MTGAATDLVTGTVTTIAVGGVFTVLRGLITGGVQLLQQRGAINAYRECRTDASDAGADITAILGSLRRHQKHPDT